MAEPNKTVPDKVPKLHLECVYENVEQPDKTLKEVPKLNMHLVYEKKVGNDTICIPLSEHDRNAKPTRDYIEEHEQEIVNDLMNKMITFMKNPPPTKEELEKEQKRIRNLIKRNGLE